jgi:hypothetical protein
MTGVESQRQDVPATESSLEERIAVIAVECGIILKDGCPGFAPEPALAASQHVAEEKGYAEAVWPWRRLMAECINYLTIQSLTFEMVLRREDVNTTNFLRAAWLLSTKAASDARCALHLCDHGFAAQAAIVARSCIETIEALAAFVLDPDSADAFVSSQTLDEANHTWFALIRNKARRAMDDAFAKFVTMDQKTEEWRQHNRRLQGALTHPSYLAPMLNLFSKWEEGRTAHPTLPARTMDCVQVSQAIASSCFEYASLVLFHLAGSPVRGEEAQPTPLHKNVGFFEEDWLDSYASRGHKFLQRLWSFYLQYQDSPPFSLWRDEIVAESEPVA